MKIIREVNGIKVVDFESIIDSKLYNFVKSLDYIEFANDMDFNQESVYNRTKFPDLNTYMRLYFSIGNFERLKADFAQYQKSEH